MYKRIMQKILLYASRKFPVITLTGPRQSGKTTLVKETFPKKKYVSLEDFDEREFARGSLFENYVALELIKQRYNQGKESNLFFWRDHTGHEIDFIIEKQAHLIPIEVKSAQTITSSFFENILYWKNLAKEDMGYLIYAGAQEQKRSEISVLPWNKVASVN